MLLAFCNQCGAYLQPGALRIVVEVTLPNGNNRMLHFDTIAHLGQYLQALSAGQQMPDPVPVMPAS